MLYNIYSPVLENTATILNSVSNNYKFEFTLPLVVSTASIGHIEIKLTSSENNKSLANPNKYIDGIIYKEATHIKDNRYSITINKNDLDPSFETHGYMWQSGFLYKIQMRFGGAVLNNLNNNYKNQQFIDWKTKNVKEGSLSEWSNIMLFTAVVLPSASFKFEAFDNTYLKRAENVLKGNLKKITSNSFPKFEVEIKQNDNNYFENLKSYHFQLIKTSFMKEAHQGVNSELIKVKCKELIETSEEIPYQPKGSSNGDGKAVCVHVFNTKLDYGCEYSIHFIGKTQKNFTIQAKTEMVLPTKKAEQATPYDFSACVNNETASIDLYWKPGSDSGPLSLTNNLLIVRRDNNNKQWHKLHYVDIKHQRETTETNKKLLYKDFLVESGTKYEYLIYCLYHNESSNLFLPIEDTVVHLQLDENNQSLTPYFEYSYLYSNGIQLPLKFNNKMSSFKRNILTTKMDTIGSQYPTIIRNGCVNYAEFPVTGLISIIADEQETFLQWRNDGYYFNNQLIIPADKVNKTDSVRIGTPALSTTVPILLHNLTNDNIFIERKFRECVEQFLNNGKPKIFKSATEGNITIVLTNISFTPKQELGRMIYEFSGTAYEIASNSIEDYIEKDIYSIGEPDMSIWEPTHYSYIGQYSGICENKPTVWMNNKLISNKYSSILDWQKDIANLKFDTAGIDQVFEKYTNLWIEQHPQVTDEEILILEKKIEALKIQCYDVETALDNNSASTAYEEQNLELLKNQLEYLKFEKNRLEDIKEFQKDWITDYKLYVGENEFLLPRNTKFQLFNFDNDDLIKTFYTNCPIVLNFQYNGKTNYYATWEYSFGGHETTFVDSIYGTFTTDKNTMSIINPFIAKKSSNNVLIPNLMINENNEKQKKFAEQYPYYKGVDISEYIRNTIKQKIEKLYLNEDEELEWGETGDQWECKIAGSSQNLFLISKIQSLSDIEILAAPGTQLKYSYEKLEGEALVKKEQYIMIGDTGRYCFKSIADPYKFNLSFSNGPRKTGEVTVADAIIKFIYTTEQTINVKNTIQEGGNE